MGIGITRNTNSPVSTIKKNSSESKTGKTGSKASQSGGAKGAKSGNADSVNLTVNAGQLQELETRIESMPVVDVGIVESVQNQLNAGDYEVNDKRTANKLIDAEKKLAGSD